MTLGPPGPLNATVKYRGSTKNDRARTRMSSCSQEKRGWGKFLSQRQREWTKFAKYPASRHRLNTIRILWINLRPNSRQTGLCKRWLLHDKTNWDIPMTRPKDSSFIPSNPPFFAILIEPIHEVDYFNHDVNALYIQQINVSKIYIQENSKKHINSSDNKRPL